MMSRSKLRRLAVLTAALLLSAAGLAATRRATAADADLDCKLSFSMSGWSALYQRADGNGTVACENGESMPVHIRVRGGGLTAGRWHIDRGTGAFTDVHRISEVLGNYAQAEANAGVVKSGTAQLLTKGTVSLALAGAGEGVDLGLSGAKFTISRTGRAYPTR